MNRQPINYIEQQSFTWIIEGRYPHENEYRPIFGVYKGDAAQADAKARNFYKTRPSGYVDVRARKPKQK